MPHVDLPQAEFKVVLLGDTFTGKTSLVLRFAEGYYRDAARSATVGAFFITKRLTVSGLTCKIQIWDTAGQEQFKPLAPMYYQSAAAAILCYDPTSAKSLDTLKYWLDELHKNVPAGRIVIAMAACKCDLLQPTNNHNNNNNNNHTDILTAKQNLHEVEELASHMGAIFVPTSAKSNENVTELFSQVAERVLQFQKQNKFAGSAIPVTLGGKSSNGANNSNNNNTSPRTSTKNTGLLSTPSSPSNNNNNNHRDDYLHRLSHMSPDNATNNNSGLDLSPSRRPMTSTTDQGSPILASPDKFESSTIPQEASKSSYLGGCGDADLLGCAAMPSLMNIPDSPPKCVIL